MAWHLTARILAGVAVFFAGVALLTCRAACALNLDPLTAEARLLSSRHVGFGSLAPDGGENTWIGRMLLPYRVEYEYTVHDVRYAGSGAMLDDPRSGRLFVAYDAGDPARARIGPTIDLYVNVLAFAAAALTAALARTASWVGRRWTASTTSAA